MTGLKQGENLIYYFPNYKLYYSSRFHRTGEGVMIWVAYCCGCELISELTVNLTYVEFVAVKIVHQYKIFITSAVYRPPNSKFDSLYLFVESN